MCYFFLIFFKYRQNEFAIRRIVWIFQRLNSFEFLIQDELRRKHFNAVQKLRVSKLPDSSEDKARLEQEILSNGSGKKLERGKFIDRIKSRILELTNLRKRYDLRSALKWRERVEQTRVKVKIVSFFRIRNLFE